MKAIFTFTLIISLISELGARQSRFNIYLYFHTVSFLCFEGFFHHDS